MNLFKTLVGDQVANKLDEVKHPVVKTSSIDRTTQLNQALQQPVQTLIPKRITYDLIKQTIVQVRVNEFIGKGKFSKDERLAEELFCLVRHYESDTKLTYERIMQAIIFVKTNDIMGAGQWSKEDHLAEYLYALVRLSGTDSPALKASEQIEATYTTVNKKRPVAIAKPQISIDPPTASVSGGHIETGVSINA